IGFWNSAARYVSGCQASSRACTDPGSNKWGVNRIGAEKNASISPICTSGRTSRKNVKSVAQHSPTPSAVIAHGTAASGTTRTCTVQRSFTSASTSATAANEKPNSAEATIQRASGSENGEAGACFSSQSPCTIASVHPETTFSKYRHGTSALKRNTA